MEKELYMDRYDDIWERISPDYLRRKKDGNIGGWMGGYGLQRYK